MAELFKAIASTNVIALSEEHLRQAGLSEDARLVPCSTDRTPRPAGLGGRDEKEAHCNHSAVMFRFVGACESSGQCFRKSQAQVELTAVMY